MDSLDTELLSSVFLLPVGTNMVDLELRKPIELLPDRTAETAEAWLRTHPEVEIVSRDRGGDYAAAARKGALQAQQIADRFHLLKNVSERLKELTDRKQTCLPEGEEHTSDAIPGSAVLTVGVYYKTYLH